MRRTDRRAGRTTGRTTRRTALAAALAATLTPAALATAEAGQHLPGAPAPSSGRAALLSVDYRSGTLDSGVPDLTTTHATAADASSVVPAGDDHAVAHKVTLGDPGYVSDGAPRSESATNAVAGGTFRVGDEHRYEFSLLLQDWKTWEPGESQSGDIVFQGKHAGGNLPSFYLMTKRNGIAFRSPTLDLQTAVVDDFRPYLGRWMRFRVDVKWTDDDTGHYRISTRMPGDSGWTARHAYEGVRTFHPKNPTAFGYLKWGLYRPGQTPENGDVPTRVVHHDDIRVTGLSGG
ncbi:heparin lyase I family protein [Streptomyces zhihengii]|uniref:Heparin lyase I family protein n=1 Tax=Streptomyces zhihengii TaxID=1818004 RepID=A0ABS2V1G8_9ACTN|nr:heparin lyase I family protein [Streptomyces zhihengii]MBM9623676.1 heparin lyase I family protein [Streptomyces zhihengii]